MEVVVKNIINIFTIIDGKINLLVKDNNIIEIDCLDQLDLINNDYIKDNIDIKDLNLKQCYTFSKKEKDKLELKVLYIDIINIDSIKLSNGFDFVELDKLDKENDYIKASIEFLKKELVLNSTIKKLYPNEFVLPEILERN